MIFLDFDGVLFDTVRESYAVAVVSSGYINSIDDIDFNSNHFFLFKRLRYLISPAWNYKYLLDGIKLDLNPSNIAKIIADEIKKAEPKDYIEFEKNFFAMRSTLKQNCLEKWLNLNKPFPFLNDALFLFNEYKHKVYIVTTKDKETVLKLLQLANIEFDRNRIFDRLDYQQSNNKRNIIESLMSKNSQNIFVDDSDKHINDCRNILNLICFQPKWGYVSLDSQTSDSETIINAINILLDR